MFRKKREGGNLDFEVNIVPIVDALTIVIIFMLASGAFLSLGVLDVGIAAPGESLSQEKPPEIEVSVELHPDKRMTLYVTGQSYNKKYKIKPGTEKERGWNLTELETHLASVKERWTEIEAATLVAHQKNEYQDVVTVMESVRKTHKKVLLGGF